MEKTYHLDLKTLLEYLQGKSAVLRTTVKVPQSRHLCLGYIFVIENTVHHYILSGDGALLLTGKGAADLLGGCSEWQVRIGTAQDIGQDLRLFAQRYALPLALPPLSPTGSAPRQKRVLDLSLLQQFSYGQSLVLRTVYALVNGQRTVEQMKLQLRLPAETVEEALAILRTLDVIE
jgi:hypothetical protein